MNPLNGRIAKIEQTAGTHRLTWLVRCRQGERSADAIARARKTMALAPSVMVVPEVCATAKEWVHGTHNRPALDRLEDRAGYRLGFGVLTDVELDGWIAAFEEKDPVRSASLFAALKTPSSVRRAP
jgi:hypothetical protein